MTQELFLPDNGQDKTPEMIAIIGEIESAEKFVSSLQERADEITSTDLDLSCTKRYDLYSTAEIIYALHSNTGVDLGIKLDPNETIAQIQIQEMPKYQLKDYFRAITFGYRRAALNILLGVGVHYKKAEGILPEFGPARNTPHSIFEDILAGETIPLISNNALMRTKFEVGLQQVRLGTNSAWTEMFDKRDDKTLALKYLERKINSDQLRDAVSKMTEPFFKFVD